MPMEPPPVGLDPLQNETHQPNRVCDKSTETPHPYVKYESHALSFLLGYSAARILPLN